MMNKEIIFELKRKSVHLFLVSFILIYVFINKYFGHRLAIFSLTFLLIFLLVIKFIRVDRQRKIPIFHILWRKNEKNSLSGDIYFLLGAIIAFSVFDFEIALVALLMTIFGDLTASLVGVSFGKHWLKNIPKTAWEGIIAEFGVNLIIGFIFLPNLIIILFMAFIATFIETIFLYADDNLVIPVFAGFGGQIVLVFLRLIGMI